MTTSRARPWLLVLAAAAASSVFAIAYWRLWGFLQDDVFISLRYAQHLALGKGLVYNVGEKVEGYTNFLWTVVLSIPFVFGWPLIPFLKIVSGALALAAAWATWRLGRATLLRDAPGLAALPALLMLVSPVVVLSAAEGLETMMFTFFLVLAAALVFEETGDERVPGSALACVGLALTRPDGAPFAAWVWLTAAFLRRPRRYLVGFLATFGALFGAYFAARAWYYRDLLPNTFYAKGGGSGALIQRGWRQLVEFVAASGAWASLASVSRLVQRRTRLAAISLAGIVLLRVAFHLWSGGPWMERHRFLVPTLPFLFVLTVAGIAGWRSRLARSVALPLACAALLLPGWLRHGAEETRARAYGAALRRAHGALGREVRQRTASGAVLAMDDAGLGPFLAERPTIDMLGLNDRHIAHLRGGFGKFDVDYVLGRRPDLVVLIGRVPGPRTDADFRIGYHGAIERSQTFRREYARVKTLEFDPEYWLLVYRRLDSTAVPADF